MIAGEGFEGTSPFLFALLALRTAPVQSKSKRLR